MSNERGKSTLDEWAKKYADGLREEIKIHIQNCSPQDVDRYIMISIRQWIEELEPWIFRKAKEKK